MNDFNNAPYKPPKNPKSSWLEKAIKLLLFIIVLAIILVIFFAVSVFIKCMP